ncbi:MAG: hypothetical protein AAGE52_16925 [Myxococcota bacterium]
MGIEHAERVQVKVFAEGDTPDVMALIPVFHQWIQKDAIDGELLIDVADYSHVHQGPGVMLIGHGSDLYFDLGDGRPGVLFSRKRAFDGTLEGRLRDAIERALRAASLLEKEDLSLRFATTELLVRVPDRLHAPNTDESFAVLKGLIETIAKEIFGTDARVERTGDARDALGARVTIENAPSLQKLSAN